MSPEYHRAYYLKHREEQLAKQRADRASWSPERRVIEAEKRKRKHDKNRERDNAKMREWRAANPERLRELTNAWRDANRGRTAANAQAYRARSRGAKGRFTDADVQLIYAEQGGKCAGCIKPLNGIFERDHVVSLKAGGTNEASNLQLLCKSCNCAKRDRPLSALLALRA